MRLGVRLAIALCELLNKGGGYTPMKWLPGVFGLQGLPFNIFQAHEIAGFSSSQARYVYAPSILPEPLHQLPLRWLCILVKSNGNSD